jgi:hypothetical protein
MKGKQLALVLFLLVALGGIALLLRNRNSASWSGSATQSNDKIFSFPLNDVAHLTIKTNEAQLNLVKKEGAWRVIERADYPADFGKVAGLLRKLWELHATQDVKAGRSQLGRLHLLEPGGNPGGGTLIDLKDSGAKPLGSLLLGKKQNEASTRVPGEGAPPGGRYVMTPAHTDHVFLISETFDEVQPKPELWLNRDFLAVQNAKSIALAGTTPAMNWKILRETADGTWTLPGAKPGEELDNATINSLLNHLANPSFVDVLPADAPPAETGLDKPSILSIETFDGFVEELRIGKLVGSNYPVLVSVKADLPNERKQVANEKPEDKSRLDEQFQTKQKQLVEKLAREQKLADRPYLIARGTVEPFLKERSALLKSNPSPSPIMPPNGGSPTKPRPIPSPSSPRRPK